MVSLPTYSTGTATVTAGGTNVALTDGTTAFDNIFAGDTFCIVTASAKVVDIVDDINFTITPWPGSNETNAAYTVLQDSKLRFTDVEIAVDLKKQVQALNTEGFYHFVAPQFADPDAAGLTADDGQYAFQASTGKLWIMQSAVWTFLGVYKGFGLPLAYDSGKTYNLFDTATSDGSTYVWINDTPASGHAPPNATYWNVLAGKGDPGDAATIAVGTVTTVANGDPATVTNSGTSSASILDFAIPQGAPGTIQSVIAGTNVTVDNTDPANPVVSATGGGDVAGDTHAATSKTTPVDADEIPLVDSAASNVLKKLTWANLKAALAAWLVSAGWIREKLTATRTYYVRTDGSDSNNGLANTSGGAFLTIQKAVDSVASLDIAGFNVVIQIADGTYTGSVILKNVVGFAAAGNLIIQGNNTTPANVVISTTASDAFNANGVSVVWDIKDLKVQTTTSGNAFNVLAGAKIRVGNLNFGACVYAHMSAFGPGSTITILSNYAVSGGGSAHVQAYYGAQIAGPFFTITITNTPAFSIAWADFEVQGNGQLHAQTFVGSATGKRFKVTNGSVCFTNGSTPSSYFPGNAAGDGTNFATSPYGLYV